MMAERAQSLGLPKAYEDAVKRDPRELIDIARSVTNLPLRSPLEVASAARDVPITQGGRAESVNLTDLEGEG